MEEFLTLAIRGSVLHLDGVTASPSSLWALVPMKVTSGAPLISKRGRTTSLSGGHALPLLQLAQK
jgi:hypothetical protein